MARRGRKPSGHPDNHFIRTDRGFNSEKCIESVRVDYTAPPRQLVAEFRRRVSYIQNMQDRMDVDFLRGRLREIRDIPGKDAKKTRGGRRILKNQLTRSIRRLEKLDHDSHEDTALRLALWRLHELERGDGGPPSKNKCSRLLKHLYDVRLTDRSFDRLWRSVNPPAK